MDKSIFTEKNVVPDDRDLEKALLSAFPLWQMIRQTVHQELKHPVEEWNYSGEKYGWNFRIKEKKRAIIYLLPRERYFKVAFVFGQKAMDEILKSEISDPIKEDLLSAKQFAEGRGIRIDVMDSRNLKDINLLIAVKINT